MTLQMSEGRGFDPVGWGLVQMEAVKKEKKLRATCVNSYENIRDDYGGHHPPAGWAWFTQAGYHDAFDREPLVKKNFPQRPVHYPHRSAGLAPTAVLLHNSMKHRST